MNTDTKCVGVRVTPEMFEQLFRKGYKAEIIESGIPDNFKVANYGFDVENNSFFFVFKIEDCPEGTPVQEWVVPTYRRID